MLESGVIFILCIFWIIGALLPIVAPLVAAVIVVHFIVKFW